MKFLIAGLGNPGVEYAGTRHNIGFMTLDALAADTLFKTDKYGQTAELSYRGRKLLLLKPNTFMNLSGKAVAYHLKQQGLPPTQLLVVTDDLALPFGTLRFRPKGSSGGHNGLKSIEELLGTSEYPRLRMGVGNDFGRGQQVDFVLSAFAPQEQQLLPELTGIAAEAIRSYAFHGLEQTMTQFNKHVISSAQ